jgi:hypothetical protein
VDPHGWTIHPYCAAWGIHPEKDSPLEYGNYTTGGCALTIYWGWCIPIAHPLSLYTVKKVSVIPAADRKTANLFIQCMYPLHSSYVAPSTPIKTSAI